MGLLLPSTPPSPNGHPWADSPPLPGNLCQMVITASQIQWTADVSKCLATCKERGDKKYLKAMKKKQVRLPLRLSAPCTHPSPFQGAVAQIVGGSPRLTSRGIQYRESWTYNGPLSDRPKVQRQWNKATYSRSSPLRPLRRPQSHAIKIQTLSNRSHL